MKGFRRLGEEFARFNRLGRGVSVGIAPVEFLFRDDFLTNEAAPLASPRTAEPGPGTGTIVDTGNLSSIVAERWTCSGVTANDDPSYADNVARDRDIGLIAYCIINTNGRVSFGFDSDLNGFVSDSGVVFITATVLEAFDDGAQVANLESVTALTDYEVAVVLRSSGAFYLVRGGSQFAEWTLYWVGFRETEGAQHAQISRRVSGSSTHDNFRVSQLPAPWDSDNGIATQVLAGARSAGDTFTHEADCLIEFEVTTVPAALQIEQRFRIQDASNFWQVTIDSAGNLDLDEVVATVVTQRGTSAGVIANGDRIVIIADDETIRVYEANTLRITYAAAANFKTDTDGELETEGTGGAVSDIISWPRVISGDALTALNRVAA